MCRVGVLIAPVLLLNRRVARSDIVCETGIPMEGRLRLPPDLSARFVIDPFQQRDQIPELLTSG